MRVIGDDIWFDGFKIGSLAVLPATVADRVRDALCGDVGADERGVIYDAGYYDGSNGLPARCP